MPVLAVGSKHTLELLLSVEVDLLRLGNLLENILNDMAVPGPNITVDRQ